MSKKYLVTGGAGFIGSNFVHYLLKTRPDDQITVIDSLTYAGNPANLEHVLDKITFVTGDICDEEVLGPLVEKCEVVVDRKSTRLNSSHPRLSRMPSSA